MILVGHCKYLNKFSVKKGQEAMAKHKLADLATINLVTFDGSKFKLDAIGTLNIAAMEAGTGGKGHLDGGVLKRGTQTKLITADAFVENGKDKLKFSINGESGSFLGVLISNADAGAERQVVAGTFSPFGVRNQEHAGAKDRERHELADQQQEAWLITKP